MRYFRYVGLIALFILVKGAAIAQCSICSKTASQLGRQSADGLNSGIVYLMALPFLVAGYIGYRWWKQEKGS